MTLAGALSSSRLAGAERSTGGTIVLIHRRSPRYHLTRYAPGETGRSPSQRWVFPILYDLLVFVRAKAHPLAGAVLLCLTRLQEGADVETVLGGF